MIIYIYIVANISVVITDIADPIAPNNGTKEKDKIKLIKAEYRYIFDNLCFKLKFIK